MGACTYVEGGVDDPGEERTPVTVARVERFVDAVTDGGAIGASHYDYATTSAALWPALAPLNDLYGASPRHSAHGMSRASGRPTRVCSCRV